jgi:cytochrome c5
MLKPILVLSLAVVLGLVAAPAPARALAPAAGGQAGKADPQAKAKGLYSRDCALCHGENGNGKTDLAKDMQLTLSDWTDPSSLSGKSDQQLFDIIRKGKDKMPDEDAGRSKDDDVKALVQYIRSMSKGQPAPAATPNH